MKTLFPFSRHRFNNEVIFEDLPNEILDLLLEDQESILYDKGEIIFKEGVQPHGVYYIKKGRVKKYTSGYQGREYLFYVSSERELLGHHGMLNNEPNPNSAAALQDSELIFIPKKNFLEAINQSQEFQARVMSNLSHEFGVFIHYAKILAQYNVRERTALALLIVNEKYLEGGSLDAIITLSREELSSMVGTVKENLVRVLKEFKEEGFISGSGRGIVIKDFDALLRISNYFD